MQTKIISPATFPHTGDERVENQVTAFPQQPASNPRVLVVVRGGVAEFVSTGDVQVFVYDWDNTEPERDCGVPKHFADLARPLNIPVESQHGLHAAVTLPTSPAQSATSAIPNVDRFTAYKVFVQDQSRSDHVRNLTLEQVRDETLFPLGPQTDESGRLFVWAYGINDGEKIV